jgi:hypothetical protein
MKDNLALAKPYILKEITYSFKYLMQDKRKLVLACLVLAVVPGINIGWRYMDPSVQREAYHSIPFFIWTLGASIGMILTSAVWYLSTARKDFATRLIALGSIYYYTFFLLSKLPFLRFISVFEEVMIFFCTTISLTLLLSYLRNHHINDPTNYKVEYDGMVYEYHHLCRGFTKTVEGLNYLKQKGYISEEEYNARLSTSTERFDEFAMKIHDRYQRLH